MSDVKDAPERKKLKLTNRELQISVASNVNRVDIIEGITVEGDFDDVSWWYQCEAEYLNHPHAKVSSVKISRDGECNVAYDGECNVAYDSHPNKAKWRVTIQASAKEKP